MKKNILLFGLLFALQLQTNLMAQLPDEKDVTFNAILGNAFNLIIVDGDNQTATFQTADDYNMGVTETQGVPGIDPGSTKVAMEATSNWYLQIMAADFLPNGAGTGSIPINNLGVYCEATGTHQFGVEVTCNYVTIDAALGLTNANATLINVMTENSGDQTDNEFILHWLMGTMNGSMNTETMFKQLADGLFSEGTYLTTVVLTMTASP